MSKFLGFTVLCVTILLASTSASAAVCLPATDANPLSIGPLPPPDPMVDPLFIGPLPPPDPMVDPLFIGPLPPPDPMVDPLFVAAS